MATEAPTGLIDEEKMVIWLKDNPGLPMQEIIGWGRIIKYADRIEAIVRKQLIDEAVKWRDDSRLVQQAVEAARKDERERSSQTCYGNAGKGRTPPVCKCFVRGWISECHRADADAILRGREGDDADEYDCPIHGKLGSPECPRC